MGLLDAILPKNYKNARILYEENLDAWRQKTEDYLNTVNLNLQQIGRDVYGSSYEYNNDGAASEATTINQYITNIIDGTQPIDGTSSDTFTINSDGDAIVISSAGITATRTYTYEDASGDILTSSGVQSLIDAVFPIGSYLIFDDFNGTLSLPSASTNYWPCDGTVVNSATSLLHGITTKDATGRALVGYTTSAEGDGSIDTASTALTGTIAIASGATTVNGTLTAFNTELESGDQILVVEGLNSQVFVVDTITSAILMTVVSVSAETYTTATGTVSLKVTGEAGNIIDLEHKHANDTMKLSSKALTGTSAEESTHNHDYGTLFAALGFINASGNPRAIIEAHTFTSNYQTVNIQAGNATDVTDRAIGVRGTTDTGSAHAHGKGTLAVNSDAIDGDTDSKLSTTQSIHMRSVQTRCYVRIL